MKAPKTPILLSCIGVLFVMLACNALVSKPTVSNIRMTTDESGNTPTSSYAPADNFFVFADLSGLSAGSVVEAKWYAVSAQGADPNSEINTSDYRYQPGISFIYFELSAIGGGNWPTGAYRVDIYLDGNKVGGQGFTVQ